MTSTQPTILLVEDNPDDEMLARRAFNSFGALYGDAGEHRMTVARDGRDAIVFYRTLQRCHADCNFASSRCTDNRLRTDVDQHKWLCKQQPAWLRY